MKEEFKLKILGLEEMLAAEALACKAAIDMKEAEMLAEKKKWMAYCQDKAVEYEQALASELGAEKLLQAEVERLKKKLQDDHEKHAEKVKRLRDEMANKLKAKDEEAKNAQDLAEAKLKDAQKKAAERYSQLQKDMQVKIDAAVAAMELLKKEMQDKIATLNRQLDDQRKIAAKNFHTANEEWKAKLAAVEAEMLKQLHDQSDAAAARETALVLELEALQAAMLQQKKDADVTLAQAMAAKDEELKSIQKQHEHEEDQLAKLCEDLAQNLQKTNLAKEQMESKLKEELAQKMHQRDLEIEALRKAMQDEINTLKNKWAKDMKEWKELERALKREMQAALTDLEGKFMAQLHEKDVAFEAAAAAHRDALEQKQKENDAALAKLRAEMQSKIDFYNQKMEQLRNDIAALNAANAKEREAMRANFERRLREKDEDNKAKLAAQAAQSEKELQQCMSSYEAKLGLLESQRKQEEKDHERAIEALKHDALTMEQKYKAWMESEHNIEEKLKQEREALKIKLAKEKKDLEHAIEVLKHDLEEERQRHKDDVERMSAENAARILEVEGLAALALAEAVKALESKLEAKDREFLEMKAFYENQLARMAAEMDQLTKQHERALAALQEELNKEKMNERAALQAMHDEMESKVNALMREKAAAVQSGLDKLQELKHHEEVALQEMEERLRQQMAEQKKQADDRIASMQDQYQKLQAKTNERLHDKELQMQQLRDSSQEQLKKLQAEMLKARNDAKSALEVAKKEKEVALLEIKKVHATQIQTFEMKIQETKTYHEERINKKVAEHNDALERAGKALAMKEKECALIKEKAAAKERDLLNDIEDLHHETDMEKKMHSATLSDMKEDFEGKLKKKNTEIEELQELMNRKLVELADEGKKAWKTEEYKLNRILEEKMNKCKEDAQTQIDAANAAAKELKTKVEAEKAKLEGLLAEKDGALKAITDKEMRSEEYLGKEEARLKKEMKLMKSEFQSQITSLNHDVEMLQAQKKREGDEAENRCNSKVKVKETMIETLKHELESQTADAKRRVKETTDLYESKLKLKEDSVFEARTEIARLKGLIDAEEDEIVEEEIDIVVERTVTVMQ